MTCVNNHQKVIYGLTNVQNLFVPCDTKTNTLTNGGSFDFTELKQSGTNVKDIPEVLILRTNSAAKIVKNLVLPRNGVLTKRDDNKLIKFNYQNDLLQGTTLVYEDTPFGELLEERVYLDDRLTQLVAYNTINNQRLIWIYSFGNPRQNCGGTNGSNAPCTSTLTQTLLSATAGVADTSKSVFKLTLKTRDGTLLTEANPINLNTTEYKYYRNKKLWVILNTNNDYIDGIVKEYPEDEGGYVPRDFRNKRIKAPYLSNDLSRIFEEYDASANIEDYSGKVFN